MNTYQERQEARRQRLMDAADKADASSRALAGAARRDAAAIPFGQPILVGHHSEGRDRRFRARIAKRMEKAADEHGRAEELRRAADRVGTGGISSDDPEAVQKLAEKLAALERKQELMKATNAAIRKAGADVKAAQLAVGALGFTEDQIAQLLKPDFAGRIGFADYQLKNNNATIRQTRERLEEMRQRAAAAATQDAPAEQAYPWGSVIEDAADNRICLTFAKENLVAREAAKALGFRWSPMRTAWVRQLNGAGRTSAELFVSRMEGR